MLKKRGSFKVAPGVRLNYGKRGFTSVNVAGVNLGSRRSRGGRRGPTKMELLEQHWRLRPGIFYVRIEPTPTDSINLVVDGGELTYRRIQRIADGLNDGNTEAVARAFKAFVKEWDVLEDDGSKPLPITKRSVDRLGTEMIFGLAVEAANALGIPKKHLGHVLTDRQTGKPPRVTVTTSPGSATALSSSPSPVPSITPTPNSHATIASSSSNKKSPVVAYALWLILGLVGGHRYYLGRTGSALLMTLTLGGVGIWWLIDLLLLRSMIETSS